MSRGITQAFERCSCYRVDHKQCPPGWALIRCGWCGETFRAQRVGNAFRFWGKLKAQGVAHTKACRKRPAEVPS